jgi:hypothetical protein
MPIDTLHPDYAQHQERWQILRDAYEGDRAIKAATARDAYTNGRLVRQPGSRYLPRPRGLDTDQYHAYVQRPAWFAATKRTIIGMRGAVFRRDPSTQGAESFQADLSDITGTGVAMTAFAKQLFAETMLMGRYGVLVDWSDAADRPYWVSYCTETIRNWRIETHQGQPRLTLVVLGETHETPAPDDRFALITTRRYRELSLENGIYVVRLWEERTGENAAGEPMRTHDVIEERIPMRRGVPLDFLPFAFVSPSDVEASIEESPVQEVVDLNLRHWRRSAGYEHGLYLTGLPTFIVTGHDPDRDEPDPETGTQPSDVTLGSQQAMFLIEPEAKAYMLEFHGQGLGAVRESLEDSKREMAVMGARLLEEQPRVNETATGVMMRQSGDISILRTLAASASSALTKALRWDAWWRGAAATPQADSIALELNREFFPHSLSPQQLQVLMSALQEGQISFETWYYNLQQGDLAEPGITAKEEQVRLDNTTMNTLRHVPVNGAAA